MSPGATRRGKASIGSRANAGNKQATSSKTADIGQSSKADVIGDGTGSDDGPIWPCSVCNDNADGGMQCDLCSCWTHYECAGLNENNKDEYESVHFLFACVSCMEVLKSLKPGLLSVRKSKNSMGKMVREANEAMVDIAKNVKKQVPSPSYADAVKHDLSEMRKEMLDMKTKMVEKVSVVSEAMLEIKEKDRRQTNIIIHQLPEAAEGSDTKEHDYAKTKEILTAVGSGTVEPLRLFRLGPKRNDGSARLLLVDVGSKDNRDSILRRAPNLRQNADFNKVFISEDRTPAEQEAMRKLVLEKKEKQKNDNAHIYVIRQYRIVQLNKRETGTNVDGEKTSPASAGGSCAPGPSNATGPDSSATTSQSKK